MSLYLSLLKKCLLDSIYRDSKAIDIDGNITGLAAPESIANGMYFPSRAHTMIGHKRLDNIQYCVESCLQANIPGDLVETGVWRGGATIFMKGILKNYNVIDRKVFVLDSFEGLPKPDPIKYPADQGDPLH